MIWRIACRRKDVPGCGLTGTGGSSSSSRFWGWYTSLRSGVVTSGVGVEAIASSCLNQQTYAHFDGIKDEMY
jgi:hypothetical protein